MHRPILLLTFGTIAFGATAHASINVHATVDVGGHHQDTVSPLVDLHTARDSRPLINLKRRMDKVAVPKTQRHESIIVSLNRRLDSKAGLFQSEIEEERLQYVSRKRHDNKVELNGSPVTKVAPTGDKVLSRRSDHDDDDQEDSENSEESGTKDDIQASEAHPKDESNRTAGSPADASSSDKKQQQQGDEPKKQASAANRKTGAMQGVAAVVVGSLLLWA